nr:hypothetical protein [Mitsuokella multacida]
MTVPEKQTIAIVLYSLACLGLSFVIVECSGRNAQRDIQAAQAETSEARAALAAAQSENATLREYTRRSDEAVLRATAAIQEALGKHEERRKSIDNSSPDWLMCELPSGVRDAFADYAACGGNNAAVGASDALRETKVLRTGE